MYSITKNENGILHVELSKWEEIHDLILGPNVKLLNFRDFSYRGHAVHTWDLLPGLYRELKKNNPNISKSDADKEEKDQLDHFRYHLRGLVKENPDKIEDKEIWAIGQHYELLSPFLDWTESPFTALFFAISKFREHVDERPCVWGLYKWNIENKIEDLKSLKSPNIPNIYFYRSYSNENKRVVNQCGTFSYVPIDTSLENWIEVNFPQPSSNNTAIMIKIVFPQMNKIARKNALKYLNRMNINHKSVYPDIIGSSQYSNMRRLIEDY